MRAVVSLASPWAKDAAGVYRAALADGRGVWVWAYAPGDWRYGLLFGCKDVPSIYAAPRLHLAKADCLALASWLRPSARPVFCRGAEHGLHWLAHPITGEVDPRNADNAGGRA